MFDVSRPTAENNSGIWVGHSGDGDKDSSIENSYRPGVSKCVGLAI